MHNSPKAILALNDPRCELVHDRLRGAFIANKFAPTPICKTAGYSILRFSQRPAFTLT